jgi:hypothetical protein
MGMWNTHGMVKDEEEQMDAVLALGLMPEELDALAVYCQGRSDISAEIATHSKGQDKRKLNLISKFWKRRYRQLKRLSALAEEEMGSAT